ncbi:MAG: PEP-CTERM sorting domain-containing protein [Pirellulales bacterium]
MGLALEGERVLIGAPYVPDRFGHGLSIGQAYLFDANTGNQLHVFDAPFIEDWDERFGWSVALNNNYVLIGAPEDGSGAEGAGAAHLFDADTGELLHTFYDPTPTQSGSFGHSVAIEGDRLLIGALGNDTILTNAGQAYLFDALTGDLIHTFNAPTPTFAGLFGSSVDLDGGRALIGAQGENSQGEQIGQTYLFDVATGGLLKTFDDPTPTESDAFGVSVALDGSHVLIGALRDDTYGADVGQAHLFTIPEPTTLVLTSLGLFVLCVRRKSRRLGTFPLSITKTLTVTLGWQRPWNASSCVHKTASTSLHHRAQNRRIADSEGVYVYCS